MNRPATSPGIDRRPGRWVAVATWVDAALVLGCLALVRRVGEAWWPATLLTFMPRWLLLPPVLVLILAAGRCRRRRLWIVQGTTALLVLGPVMAASLPARRPWADDSRGFRLRILTLNRGTEGIDARRLIRLIERER